MEYRFGAADPVPDWARGKSVTEVVGLSRQMAEALAAGAGPAPAAPGAGTGAGDGTALPTDDEFATDPRTATQKLLDASFKTRIDPWLQQINANAANAARTSAVASFSDDFRRWGPEIDATMVNAPVEQRTFDNYQKVVRYVRGIHQDEIVAEKTEERVRARLAEVGALGERSTGAPGGPISGTSPLAADKLPAHVLEAMRQKGVSEAMVRDFCAKNDMSIEAWAQMFAKGDVITTEGPYTFSVTGEKLGIKRAFQD